ncbi:PREDICTED: amyloid beta A4 precursor protein-binding family A member 2-like isoform X10 [Nicrophorus vespilloides]|uniref:Amyloid beta A4 precursor protein-binding family A member 2-like isoform X10 n=1 Tax=Nicrophorus vespilloides TaxID=110193 RepID=A0ABM1NJS6_NICVS|nr:PREDICTED: amyloid beta A4 precursor protein-binding family A member 2-like isoform X10 [Nicrophorus vespilloides]
MTSLTLALDNDVTENTEQISKLFPKCRPRSDINLNPIISSSGREHEHNTTDNSNNIMNIDRDNDRWVMDGSYTDNRDNSSQVHSPIDDDDIIDHEHIGGTYKLRDSRIIEIAGGREIYSQSRSKAARKSRNLGADDLDKKKGQKSPSRQGVWELRRCNESKKYRNSREFTETVFSSEVCSVTHPQDQQAELQQQQQQPPAAVRGSPEGCHETRKSPVRVSATGEVVVFDDIGDSWQEECKRMEEENRSESTSPSPYNHTAAEMESERVTKVIGNLPIAVYEGSPRRYGPRQQESNCTHPQLPSAQSLLASPSVYPPRPGFPQRVVCSPSETDAPSSIADNYNRNSKPGSPRTTTSTFDYLYEFSETRKVLEEFFKCPPPEEENRLEAEFQDLEYELRRQANDNSGNSYVGQRLAKGRSDQAQDFCLRVDSPRKHSSSLIGIQEHDITEHENNFLDLSIGTGSSGDLGETEVGLQVGHSRNFTLSPETTDCDSNCGDLDSEVSLMLMENELVPSSGLLGSSGDLAIPNDSLRLYSSMPVLEDGLSSGHASDTDNNNPTVMLMKRQITEIEREINQGIKNKQLNNRTLENGLSPGKECLSATPIDMINGLNSYDELKHQQTDSSEKTPPPPAPAPHRCITGESSDVEAAIKDIRLTLQRTKTLPLKCHPEAECEENAVSPVWVPRQRGLSATSGDSDRKVQSGEEGGDEEEADTDLETDRLLGQQRTDDQGFYDDKGWRKPKSRTIMPPLSLSQTPKQIQPLDDGAVPLVSSDPLNSNHSSPNVTSDKSQSPQSQKGSISSVKLKKDKDNKKKGRNKEGFLDPTVLIEGVLFRARYLGSTQLVCEGQPTKTTRMMQAEEAVSRIKALAPDGETQPSTEVDLFISTEKIMVLNTDLKEIMMDHALRTISYIADIGDLVVLMARRRFVPHEMEEAPKINRTPKMICHVFESEEAQFIAQSIGQAFQVAYMEFLKANGIEDHSFVKEMDYQEVLNSQEIFGDELQMFAKKEMQKEVVVPKAKGEILGVVIVESGWGSMLPTVVIANLAPAGAAARCGQLNIGDQIIAINGVSLVGLPLSTCQNYIKNSKNQTVVKLTVVPCAPVVEVKIKRPDTKYQLGFSVQNGVICSLLRGGIAERGGVRVGHRIIEINNQSVVAVPHEKIVNLLATSVGEVILMKTMPTSMFRLLTGQENPVYI